MNIKDISSTLLVSKFEKSKYPMLAPSNICDIFLAFDVDIFPRSISPNLNEANIYEKSSTLAAFNPSTFSISELKNNLDIDLTESKLNPSIAIDFKFWQA